MNAAWLYDIETTVQKECWVTYILDTIVTVVFAPPMKIVPNKATAEPLQHSRVSEQIVWVSDSMTHSQRQSAEWLMNCLNEWLNGLLIMQ